MSRHFAGIEPPTCLINSLFKLAHASNHKGDLLTLEDNEPLKKRKVLRNETVYSIPKDSEL